MSQGQQQRGGRGSSPRQGPAPAGREERPATQNEQISRDQSAKTRMEALFALIRDRRAEVEAVLPPDVPYVKFEAVVNMAIRREPRLLECYAPSFIKACIQAAYDGLLPDGNQAVILYSNNKVPGTGRDGVAAVYRLEARYQSMVYGLRMKIVHSGAATFVDAMVVFEKEPFRYRRGLQPVLEHEPSLNTTTRGDPIAVYAIATLPDGTKVFDVLTKKEVMAARDVAKTKDVWDGPFGMEMWKKTAIRRLSKAIPTTRPIRDAEAIEMFPQFADTPRMGALPAPSRPQRSDYRPALEHAVEVPLDLHAFDGGYDTEESRRATAAAAAETSGAASAPAEEGKAAPKKKAAAKSDSRIATDAATDNNRQQNIEGASVRKDGQVLSPDSSGSETGGSPNGETGAGAGPTAEGEGDAAASSSPDLPLPQDDAQWNSWAEILIGGLEKLPTAEAVDAEHSRNRSLIDAAPDAVRRRVVAAMTERMTDIVADAGQGALEIGEEPR